MQGWSGAAGLDRQNPYTVKVNVVLPVVPFASVAITFTE
jgi:hypothetical protein